MIIYYELICPSLNKHFMQEDNIYSDTEGKSLFIR